MASNNLVGDLNNTLDTALFRDLEGVVGVVVPDFLGVLNLKKLSAKIQISSMVEKLSTKIFSVKIQISRFYVER